LFFTRRPCFRTPRKNAGTAVEPNRGGVVSNSYLLLPVVVVIAGHRIL
jgi:hypothetical protein